LSKVGNYSTMSTMSVDNVVKVANISPLVTEPVLKQLFEFLGEVTTIKLYNSPHGDGVQECTIEFKEASAAVTALHLTGVELGDRTLMVSSTTAPAGIHNTSYQPPVIPPSLPPIPPSISPPRPPQTSKTPQSIPPKPIIPPLALPPFSSNSLAAIRSNPAISPTVAQFDPAKAEEISRTMAGDPAQPTRFAFLEFATYEGAQAAMQMNGVMLGDRPLKVNHSKNAINKTPK
ncbi:hypothetical protein GLOIN_2v1538838, partial [Rhizophagus irregularis DAOM 181602=DAOM 197198]